VHWGQHAPLRTCVYIYLYIHHIYTYTHPPHWSVSHQNRSYLRSPSPEKCCCNVKPSGSHTQTAPALHHQETKAGEEERWRRAFRRRRGGTKGTPAPPQQRPRAVSYLCTCGRAHNNELCHIPFSLRGISSPFLWDLSGEII